MAVSFIKLRENSLYWNSDSTNITAACHNELLLKFYLDNELVKPGTYSINGTKIDLSTIDILLYFISANQDYIAGIENPPAKKKHSYWANSKLSESLSR